MNESGDMTFLGHLESLRFVILKILFAYALLFIPAWIFSAPLTDRLLDFAAPSGFKLHYFSLMEPFFIRLKMSAVLDLFASLPFTLYFIWNFISPGLYEAERRILRLPFILSVFLALAGIAFALFFLLPAVVGFSLSFSGPRMDPVIGIDSFVSMALLLVLACSVMFQFPLILFGLMTANVIQPETLTKQRPFVIVLILVVSAFLTPPDVISQIMLALPAWLLFELSIFLFRLRKKNAEK